MRHIKDAKVNSDMESSRKGAGRENEKRVFCVFFEISVLMWSVQVRLSTF